MKVLSDIYTYSKDKSSVVFSSNSLTESNKQKKKVEESSWFSKKWLSNSSMNSSKSWYNKISLPKYQIPKMPSFNLSFPKYTFPKCTFPKCSFPKCTLPTVWFKNFIVKLEETRINCYLYLVELFKIVKEKSCVCLNCSFINCACLQFNSNPEYAKFPWYKRVFFTIRDNVNGYVSLNKECVLSYIHRSKKNEEDINEDKEKKVEESEEENTNFDKKGSKGKVDEERISRGNNSDEIYTMKYSQSSKYSNDLTTLRSSKKLKKTNTDDLKNGEEIINSINNNNNNENNENNDNNSTKKTNRVFSMFSKSDAGNKSSNANNSPINKSGSLYLDENDNKIEDNENKNVNEITNEESIPGSNETTTESTKFNIKKTWDKFSKIIS